MALLDDTTTKKADVALDLAENEEELSKLAPRVQELSKAATAAKNDYEKARARYHELLTEITGLEGAASWLNPADGMVYQRSESEVGGGFDADKFREEHPDQAHLVVPTGYQLDELAASVYVNEHPEFLKVLQEYYVPGKTQLRVGKPRQATIEELATGRVEL